MWNSGNYKLTICRLNNCKLYVSHGKLDGVGPVDNRRSIVKQLASPLCKKKSDMWHGTHNTWHMTCDTFYAGGGQHCFKILAQTQGLLIMCCNIQTSWYKLHITNCIVAIWVFEFCHNLIFVTFGFLSFFSQFDFCHNLSLVTIWILSQDEFLSFVTIWVYLFFFVALFEFCYQLSFSPFDFFLSPFFFSFITIWFLSFITIWVLSFFHPLLFWVSAQFKFLSFITIWVFEFCHDLSFWAS